MSEGINNFRNRLKNMPEEEVKRKYAEKYGIYGRK